MSRGPGSSQREGLRQEIIRTFIAIEVPASIKNRIDLLQQRLRQSDAQVSWTRPENVHLTIKFLGNVEQSRIEVVCRAVEQAANAIEEFNIEVNGAGCFPSAKNPRVLWIGLGNLPDQLRRLHAAVEDELAREGFPREPKRFSPHLTIGRIRGQHNARQLAEKLVGEGFEPETFRADRVVVMRSDLKPTGSVYTPQAIINLKG